VGQAQAREGVTLGLQGKVAVVSGASRGIGRAIALACARQGMDVAFNYLRNRKAAEETRQGIEALGVRCLAVKANVAEPERVKELAAAIGEAFGRVDLLVSNAASGVERGALDLTLHHWHWTMDINAWGFLSLVQELAPLMEGGASVVAISSLGAVRALPYYTAVGASKAALESLARHLAVELGPRGIRVNVLSAGPVDTDALRHFPNRAELLAESARRTPLGRIVTAEEVAAGVLFLASDLSRMVTGTTLTVDGGYAAVG
jgi:enoyl-[acyl-carrier protein] reductase III